MSAPDPKSQDLDPIESAFDISLRPLFFEEFAVVRAEGLPAPISSPDSPSQSDLFKAQPWI
jgi:hypothetical protein